IPGVVAMLLLAQIRHRVPSVTEPDPADLEPSADQTAPTGLWSTVIGADLPRDFHLFSLAVALTTAGLMTFGVISYRFVEAGLISLAAAPLVYAMAMAVEAVAALATGDLYDRYGGRVLLAVPVIVSAVPALVFAPHLTPVLGGIVLWGLATGIQDSTVKAFVADLVPSRRRATAYGVFAAVQGLGAIAGGVLAGALATDHAGTLAGTIGLLQACSFVLLVRLTRSPARH
ncbi:MAG: MFS transporter, partial [Marmoricola sp.]